MTPRVLVFGTSYTPNIEKVEFLYDWFLCLLKQIDHLPISPFNALAIDSDSPQDQWKNSPLKIPWFSFLDNIGHLAINGKDGWGRAFTYGIQEAINLKYDYVVHIECDIVFKFNIMEVIAKMEQENLKVVSTICKPYGGLETGIMFMQTQFMKDIDFIKKYDWPNKIASDYPEHIVESLIGSENITYMNWIGARVDGQFITKQAVAKFDYITHCSGQLRNEFMGR